MTLDAHGRELIGRIAGPIGAVLARIGVSPNGLTTTGVVLTGVAAGFVATGRLAVGGWVLVFGGLADTFDGAVARARGESSTSGAFFDSVADRVTDGMILAAVAWAVRGDPVTFALAAVALVAAQVTSYIRAKAESLDVSCHVGLVERGERAIATIAGLVLHWWLLTPAMAFLAVGGLITVVHRFVHVHRKLRSTVA